MTKLSQVETRTQPQAALPAVDFSGNKLVSLFGTRFPIIQAGMVWVSGGKLAAAASNAGALGIIGAGSMNLDLLKHHILKAQALTKNPLAVNLPLLYHGIEDQIALCLDLGIKIFFTSAGSPKKYTPMLKSKNCIVVHVTSSPDLAKNVRTPELMPSWQKVLRRVGIMAEMKSPQWF